MTQYHFRILKCETWWGFGTKAGLRHPWLEHSPRDVREREKPEGTELLLICQVWMYRFDFSGNQYISDLMCTNWPEKPRHSCYSCKFSLLKEDRTELFPKQINLMWKVSFKDIYITWVVKKTKSNF